VLVHRAIGKKVHIFNVYAPPQSNEESIFWQCLNEMQGSSYDKYFIVEGDFNMNFSSEEKKVRLGGRTTMQY
jgi:hypothetical protein